jgi:predicted transport protein
MEQAVQTMIDNLHKNSGKTLEEWIEIVQKENIDKHGQIIKFLKEKHGFTYGFANLVAHKARGSDAGSVENKEDLIENQFKGKEHFKPLYETIIAEVRKFGRDVEIAPKKNSVSLRRKKQFALLQPATKSRFEIGINLKGHQPEGKLESVTKANAMCSHQINISENELPDDEVFGWLKKAYETAG